MTPIAFPEANKVYTKPASMTAEECGELAVYDTGGALISCWQPSDAERAAIAAGSPIWLWVIGGAQPPVAIQTDAPFVTMSNNR